jgi:hypothetical protein
MSVELSEWNCHSIGRLTTARACGAAIEELDSLDLRFLDFEDRLGLTAEDAPARQR